MKYHYLASCKTTSRYNYLAFCKTTSQYQTWSSLKENTIYHFHHFTCCQRPLLPNRGQP
jgi:hypothetical protein